MTEERSMTNALRALLPKAFPGFLESEHWLVIDHEGKSDLEASYPRKMREWREPGVRFVILRDNDGSDCHALEERLAARVLQDAPEHRIRIVCQELESCFLGDLAAVAVAYPAAARHGSYQSLAKRDPDALTNAAELVENLTGTRTKSARALNIAAALDPTANRSKSFEVFLEGVRQLIGR